MNQVRIIYLVLVLALSQVFVKCQDNENDDTHEEPHKYTITNEVFFDIEIRSSKTSEAIKSGRVVIGVFGDICPMTATNFVQLAKGFKRDNVRYLYTLNLFY